MNHSSNLRLVIGQKNSSKSFIKTTHNKKQYRRLVAILQKVKGRTYQDIANEHGVSSRSVQRWVVGFSAEALEIKLKKPGGLKSSITSEDKEIILSVLFNDPHIFGYIRNTWKLKISCKMSYKRDWYFNQFQTPTTHN